MRHILTEYAMNWQNIRKTDRITIVLVGLVWIHTSLTLVITAAYGKSALSSPPYEGGVAAVSVDGVVL